MKAHVFIVSTGVIAFGILGGNFTFNIQCKRWNTTNDTKATNLNNVFNHVCLHEPSREWCIKACHTSGKRMIILYNSCMRPTVGVLVTASPWIMLGLLLCTIISVYYLMLPSHQVDNSSVYDIGVSLHALSLDCDEHGHNHSNTSWFSELHKLDLLNVRVNSPPPVTMDTNSKQIISPPKLKLHGVFSSQQDRITGNIQSTSNHKQYYVIIIIILCLLLVSVTCNVVLIYRIT